MKILKILMRVLYAFFPEIFSGTLTNDARASFPTKNCSHKSARHLPMTRARAKCAFFPEIFSGTLTNDARAFDARRYAYFTIGQFIRPILVMHMIHLIHFICLLYLIHQVYLIHHLMRLKNLIHLICLNVNLIELV